jgi:hypothetical protein
MVTYPIARKCVPMCHHEYIDETAYEIEAEEEAEDEEEEREVVVGLA